MPRLSFTLRDVFWLTLVVGLTLGWWVHVRSFRTAVRNAKFYKSVLSVLKEVAPETCGVIYVKDETVWIKMVHLRGILEEGSAIGYKLTEPPVGQP
jgi:hypothetical protein